MRPDSKNAAAREKAEAHMVLARRFGEEVMQTVARDLEAITPSIGQEAAAMAHALVAAAVAAAYEKAEEEAVATFHEAADAAGPEAEAEAQAAAAAEAAVVRCRSEARVYLQDKARRLAAGRVEAKDHVMES
ncbi:hypothetical protein HYH03_015321 [Edaphochlamys debaryana]|uniref:Uncharacterized protein n=1 Tax=Edaphochlamys debaryana TaxID=47281 RepID=A0A835XNG3_9CHLO|nr:hypothetical protein HYH03_015321 [Edaphochlamys debaryana]|eukprot:KAG2486008.1 hypothetical protein HYH03_015321 [Edaphochlamys debaryana]